MQDDRAFKCGRCGNYEYETELAEKVCRNCASKAVVENCHSLQQLRREIRDVLSDSVFMHCEDVVSVSMSEVNLARLRELSRD